MKKKLITSLSVIGGVSAGLYAYSHLIEKRSLASFSLEKSLGLLNFPRKRKNQASFMTHLLDHAAKVNQLPVKNPKKYLSGPVTEFYFEGMQVFSWNDLADPRQKVIFYLHGGAYVAQPSAFHFKAVDRIAKETGARVIFPIYPKLPAADFQVAYPKIEALYQEVLLSIFSARQITLMGDSAGGGLALGLALLLKQNELPQPKNIILLSPWLDIDTNNPVTQKFAATDPLLSVEQLSILGKLWGAGQLKNPLVSPLYGDFAGLGQISLFIGTHELFYPSALVLRQKLQELELPHHFVIGEKMNHVYPILPIPEAKKAQQKIAELILAN
ncbi:alpha/beta hydrolase fold domain-containing protein [Enterococcus sp. LJL120]